MTQKNKDRVINALIGILTGGSVVLFGTFITNKNGDSLAIKKDIENLKLNKVSNTDFTKYKDDHLKNVHEPERENLKEVKSDVKETRQMVYDIHKILIDKK